MAAVACGIDIGGTKIAGGLVTPEGAIVYREERPTLAHEGGRAVAGRARALVEHLVQKAEGQGLEPVGIGVGAGGAISGGRVVGATSLIQDWVGTDLVHAIRYRELPVRADNDVKAMAHAELLWGEARGTRSALLVALGTGVGGAVIVNGTVVEGADGLAGHLGHVPVRSDGPPCSCGLRGCVEAYISGTAILRAAQHRLAEEGLSTRLPNASAVWEAAQAGASWAQATLEEAVDAFAVGFRGLVFALNPERIILAGGLSTWGEPFRQLLWKRLRLQLPDHFSQHLTLSLSRWRSELGILGAAAMVFRETGFPNESPHPSGPQ